MKKEAQEKIALGMHFSDRCQFCGEFKEKVEPYLCEGCRDKIFEWINSKGWSILQIGEPPLLSKEEAYKAYDTGWLLHINEALTDYELVMLKALAVAQAQREADKKWYRGKL